MAQFPRLLEAIRLAKPDEAEESFGWYAVREKDDKVGAGPYTTYRECMADMKTKAWFKTHGAGDDKIYYVAHGWVDDNEKFNGQEPE